MNRLHFNSAIFVSVLTLGVVACSDDNTSSKGTPDGGGETDGGGGGSKGSGGSTSGSGGSKATGGSTSGSGGSKATGGSTSGSGGASASGGSTGDGGPTEGGSPEAGGDAGDPCAKYCEDIIATCTGNDAQFPEDGGGEAACLTACAGYDNSDPSTITGDTFGCRRYHLGNAMKPGGVAAGHCGHAGPTGGGVCE